MTLDHVAATYRTPTAALIERLGLPAEIDPKTSLKSLAEQAGRAPRLYVQQIQRAIADIARSTAPDRVNEGSSWFGKISDLFLTALLVYGYPALGLIVFVTRTFISHLSSIASLLAGMSRFRLPRFLAIALAGRFIWTAAYLGLGYGIGADWEAATGFLTNLSGLLIALIVLAGSGLVAAGRLSAQVKKVEVKAAA